MFDTSVLVAALLEEHSLHPMAEPWLARALAGEDDFLVCTHCLAELYSALSRLPGRANVSCADAWLIVRDNVERRAELVPLSTDDYSAVVQQMAERGLRGGVIYDALITRAAQKSNADRLLTFNPKDFLRVWPEGEGIIMVPGA
jgi:predicted nucleic acid-binding protein